MLSVRSVCLSFNEFVKIGGLVLRVVGSRFIGFRVEVEVHYISGRGIND